MAMLLCGSVVIEIEWLHSPRAGSRLASRPRWLSRREQVFKGLLTVESCRLFFQIEAVESGDLASSFFTG